MLGPGVNLARVPWGGRNFEYQGEVLTVNVADSTQWILHVMLWLQDPHLAAEMVYQEVRAG
jgi:hypothetical protein